MNVSLGEFLYPSENATRLSTIQSDLTFSSKRNEDYSKWSSLNSFVKKGLPSPPSLLAEESSVLFLAVI